MLVRLWPGRSGQLEPIKGIFEVSNPRHGAHTLQERVHFVGFVNEKEYCDGCLQKYSYYLPNWHLFRSDASVHDVYSHYPLRQGIVSTGS